MFKKDVAAGGKSKVKSSVQRTLRAKLLETYPLLEPYIDEIMPKKEQLDQIKLGLSSECHYTLSLANHCSIRS